MGASSYSPAGFAGRLLLFPALVTALQVCDSLQHHQKMLNLQILQLLAQSSPHIPLECLAQVTAFNFPAKNLTVGKPQLAGRVAYKILTGFLGLFSSHPVEMGWATADKERLLNALHAQSKRIKDCFGKENTRPQSPDVSLNKLILRRYFRGIRTFLQENSHSRCAGPVEQLGVRTCLTYLDMLTKRMNS